MNLSTIIKEIVNRKALEKFKSFSVGDEKIRRTRAYGKKMIKSQQINRAFFMWRKLSNGMKKG
ncbi:hypothetical protein MUJ63_03575 [Lachnospiraceae bacterium NSJ-143]|nr:hypothetical protein [Lachnospiraceae bacterium NSJ-143]